MKFKYKSYSVELTLLTIEYPPFPCEKGERAVMTWQVIIDDDNEPLIKKGSKREVIEKVKKYIRNLEPLFDRHEEDF
jgi:hypothetical protein